MHQGWPKFVSHLWMKTADGGLVAAAWAPCRVATRLRDVPVTISVETDYPFREVVHVTVTAARRARFPILLRVPAWAKEPTVRVGSETDRPMRAGSLHRLEREWGNDTRLTLRFPMRAAVSVRYNEAIAVERGPLVYSLKIGEQWSRVNADKPHRELPHGDFEVKPNTPWNYGLIVDDRRPEESVRFEERAIGERAFSPEGAGVVATARGRRIPNWKIVNGWAGDLSPADAAWADPGRATTDQPVETVTLIPYGCTNIRISEFPRVRGE
jgi:hypothetical protein